MESKSQCHNCRKWVDFRKLNKHNCHVLRSHQTASTSTQPISHNNLKNKEDLQCSFCGLQMANPKLLEIHMRSCMHRNMSLICKLCRNPIRLRALGKPYCADCSSVKEGNQEYGLRYKTATLSESSTNKSPPTYTVLGKNTENQNLPIVDCADVRSSLNSTKQKGEPISHLQKQRKVKLKMNFSKQQTKEKEIPNLNSKIIYAKEVNNKEVAMDLSCESHHTSDKLIKNSRKNVLQQKKHIKRTNLEDSSEKLKTNTLRKLSLKTSKNADEKIRQTKKSDNLLGRNNTSNKKVTVKLLLDSIPEHDCGMLLQSSSANKADHYYKCCRCGKAFRSIKLGSIHYSNCKSNKLLNTEVSCRDTKWVCTICHSSFLTNVQLVNHLKVCNIFTKKYERACEKRCGKCHFRCLSSLLFQQHDCTKELKSMEACAVRLNVVKINSSASRVVMRECEFCGEIFDEQFTEEHFQSHHPGAPSSGNFKQYYVNLNRESSSDTVVVKTEPVSPLHDFVENGSYNFHYPDPYLHVNNSSSNAVPDNISMPPPTTHFPIVQSAKSCLPIVESTISLPAHQPSSTQPISSHSNSDAVRIINQQICKCIKRSMSDDTKPCLKCLSQLDIIKFTQNFKVIPFQVAKIKKETSDFEVSNSNTQADGRTTTSLSQSEVVDIDSERNLFNFQFLQNFQLHPSLTPPSSHDGISPPATPLVQSLANGEPCSASDVSIGSLNDAISMVPDISQLDEPRCPDQLVHYINDDCSPDIPLMQCDDQELFTPLESCSLTHLWDVDSLDNVDVWAMVPSEGDEIIEKYICSDCISFSTLDKNSILKHLCQNHEKKLEYLAMYVTKTEKDPHSLGHES